MSCAVDNNNFELEITPSRKRKRGKINSYQNTSKHTCDCFTNDAFGSTPRNEIKVFIENIDNGITSTLKTEQKGNLSRFPVESCLEIKSIFDIFNHQKNKQSANPLEVVRKPPKKKKKSDIADACFENPGLNLAIPEKRFNPFEIKRDSALKLEVSNEPKCFINPALDIRVKEENFVRNPFEVPRTGQCSETEATGIENAGLDLVSGTLAIGIPFKPTVGCKIDFSSLTPSKLLAEKLVFSPMDPKQREAHECGEEDSTRDIGCELDRYQLELENSINEKKQHKTDVTRQPFLEKLEDIAEMSLENQSELEEATEPKTPQAGDFVPTDGSMPITKLEAMETPPVQVTVETVCATANTTNADEPINHSKQGESFTDDDGIDYDVTDDEIGDFDSKTPQFCRFYRKPEPAEEKPTNKEISSSADGLLSTTSKGSKYPMKNFFRSSIRRIISLKKNSSEVPDNAEEPSSSNSNHGSHRILNSIRQSLRRHPPKMENEAEAAQPHDVSIVDATERKLKLKSELVGAEYIKVEDLTNEKKMSLRRSIRKSTRDVKNQIMKSVFNKTVEDYGVTK